MTKDTVARIQNLRRLFPSLKVDVSLKENADSNYNSLVVEISNLSVVLGRVEYPFEKTEYSSAQAFKEKVDNALQSCLDVVGEYNKESAEKLIKEAEKANKEEKPSEIYHEAITTKDDNDKKEDNKPAKVEPVKQEQKEDEKIEKKEAPSEKQESNVKVTHKPKEKEMSLEEEAAAEVIQKFADEADISIDTTEQPMYEGFPIPVRNAYLQKSVDPSNYGSTLGEVLELSPAKIKWLANTKFTGSKLKELEDDIKAAKVLFEYFSKTTKVFN